MSDDSDTQTDDLEIDQDGDIEETAEGGGKKKMAGKKLVLFVILPALLVIIGGGTAATMLLGGGKAEASVESEEPKPEAKAKGKGKAPDPKAKGKGGNGADEGSVKAADEAESNGATIQIGEPGNPSFYTMPKLLVTVSNGSGRRSQLLLKLTLETGDPEIFKRVDAMLPRITDQFQIFLREMRVDDLSGSAGDYRIRRELLRRVNMSLYPETVDAVLIEEFIVQ